MAFCCSRNWLRAAVAVLDTDGVTDELSKDGVLSLTVNEVTDDIFGVNIIPHTAAVTGFGLLRPGDAVNIEIDMLARYVARLAEFK